MLAWDRPIEPPLKDWFGQDGSGPQQRYMGAPERRSWSAPDSYSGPKLLEATARFYRGGTNHRGANYEAASRSRQLTNDRKRFRDSKGSTRIRDAPPLLTLHSAGRPRHTGRTGDRLIVSVPDPSTTEGWATKRVDGFAPPKRTLFAGSGVSQLELVPNWLAHCRSLKEDRWQATQDEERYNWQLAVGYRCVKLIWEWHKVAFLTRFLRQVFERCDATKHWAAFKLWKENVGGTGIIDKWRAMGLALFKNSTVGLIMEMLRRMKLLMRVLKRVLNMKLAAGFGKWKFECLFMYNVRVWKEISLAAWKKLHPLYILMRKLRFMKRTISRMMNVWLAAGWAKWRENHLKEIEAFKKSFLLKMLNRMMLVGWRVWHEWYVQERRRRILTGMFNRMLQRGLAMAWQKWEHVFKEEKILRWILNRLCKFSETGMLVHALGLWKHMPGTKVGRPRLGHCDCVYMVNSGRHSRCGFHKHFDNRMQKLRGELNASLEGRPGFYGNSAAVSQALSVGFHEHILSVSGGRYTQNPESGQIVSVTRGQRLRRNRFGRIPPELRDSVESSGFGTSGERHKHHTMTRW